MMVNPRLLKIAAAIERNDGTVAADHPRGSFTGHTLPTPWTPLDRAYFNPAWHGVALTVARSPDYASASLIDDESHGMAARVFQRTVTA